MKWDTCKRNVSICDVSTAQDHIRKGTGVAGGWGTHVSAVWCTAVVCSCSGRLHVSPELMQQTGPILGAGDDRLQGQMCMPTGVYSLGMIHIVK